MTDKEFYQRIVIACIRPDDVAPCETGTLFERARAIYEAYHESLKTLKPSDGVPKAIE